MGDAITRNLVFRFWQLRSSERKAITLGLGLIVKEDLKVPEPERYGRALIAASKQGKLEELEREIGKRETANDRHA